MQDKIYAVIDTNVVVSALFSLNGNSNPANVIRCILYGKITPLYNKEILMEYREVLSRDKFPFEESDIANILDLFVEKGICTERACTDEIFTDIDDLVFYEVALGKESSYLVTGNLKHFPQKPFVVTPAEMMSIVHAFENRAINKLCDEGTHYYTKYMEK